MRWLVGAGLVLLSRGAGAIVCYVCSGKNGECINKADPGQAVTCKSVRSLIQPAVMEDLDLSWKEIATNKKPSTIFGVLETVFSPVDRSKDPLPLVFEQKRNMTFDNTTYDQLAEMTAELLEAIIAVDPKVPENACTYNPKTVTGNPGTFRRCLYRRPLTMADWPEVKKNLVRRRDFVNGVRHTAANSHKSAHLCTEDRCNRNGTRSCMECRGPNHQCMDGSAGVSMACPHTHTYCIKELSGDVSNRELVARYCGTAYDKEAICRPEGDNIGIAAKGVVRCCSNDPAQDDGADDCNNSYRPEFGMSLVAPVLLYRLLL